MILLIITAIFLNTAQAQVPLLSAHEAPLYLYRAHLRSFSSLQEFKEFLPFYLEQIREQRYNIYSNLEHVIEFLRSNLGYIEQIRILEPENSIVKKIHNILTKTLQTDNNIKTCILNWIFESSDKDLLFRRRYLELTKALDVLQTKFNVGDNVNVQDIQPDTRKLITEDLIRLYKELNLSLLKILEIKKKYDPSSIKDTNFFRYLEYISRHVNLEAFEKNEFWEIGEEQKRVRELELKLEWERKIAEQKRIKLNTLESNFLAFMESLEWNQPLRFRDLYDMHSMFKSTPSGGGSSHLTQADLIHLIERISNRPTVQLPSDPTGTLSDFGIVRRLENLLYSIVEGDLLEEFKDRKELSLLFKQMMSEKIDATYTWRGLEDIFGYPFSFSDLDTRKFGKNKESLDAKAVFSHPPFFKWMKENQNSKIMYAAYQISFFINYISPEKIRELTEKIQKTQNRDLIKWMEIIRACHQLSQITVAAR